MKERKIEIEYQFAQLEELSQEEQNLVEKAIAATQNSSHQDSVLKERQSLLHRQAIRNYPSRPLPSLQEMTTDFSRIRFLHVELAARSSSK